MCKRNGYINNRILFRRRQLSINPYVRSYYVSPVHAVNFVQFILANIFSCRYVTTNERNIGILGKLDRQSIAFISIMRVCTKIITR